MKRLFLFLLTNILVIVTVSITLSVFGVGPYLTPYGLDYQSLLIFCAIFGFIGAFISLAMSRFMAKRMLGIQVITPNQAMGGEARFLVETVHRYAQDAGITTMPEVGVYESAEVNAFATGPGKNRALVAVSTGLLNQMDKNAIEGVIGHEMAHISNGDMVTMALIQGVINTFVMFFARIAAWAVASFLSGDEEDAPPSYMVMFLLTIVFEIFLSILGSVAVCFFSRKREYAADREGAMLAGKKKMIHALQSLKATTKMIDTAHQSLATLKINGSDSKFMRLLASHPDLDDRIARLEEMST